MQFLIPQFLGIYDRLKWRKSRRSSNHRSSQPMILGSFTKKPTTRTPTLLVGGWATYPSEKWRESQLGWHDLPNWMESHEIPWFQTTNQYIIIIIPLLTISSPYHHQIITIINHIPWFQSPPIRLCGCCLKYPRWPLFPFRSCIRRPLDQQKPSLGPRSSPHETNILMDCFKGKSTGNHGFYHQI